MALDNLEYISIEKQVTDFPKHYHETFCISLVHRGIQMNDLDAQCVYGDAGSLTITNPYEIHSNPVFDPDLDLGFDTIYISKDLMKYALNGENIIFLERKIVDALARQLFERLRDAIDTKNLSYIENVLFQFAAHLKNYAQKRKADYVELNPTAFLRVNAFIENNLTEKFSLDHLAKIANTNKYAFVKNFRISTGMSPMNYVLMKKIFSAKSMIKKDTVLTPLAYDYSFTDMAHFSKTFKRYIGISPKAYQNGTLNL